MYEGDDEELTPELLEISELIEFGLQSGIELVASQEFGSASLFELERSEGGLVAESITGILMPFGGSERALNKIANGHLAESSSPIGVLVSQGVLGGNPAVFVSIHRRDEAEAWSFAQPYIPGDQGMEYCGDIVVLPRFECGFAVGFEQADDARPAETVFFERSKSVARIASVYSGDFIRFVKKNAGKTVAQNLDYSDDSLGVIDFVAEQLRGQFQVDPPSEKDEHVYCMMLGSYLGEIACRHHGFRWGWKRTESGQQYALRRDNGDTISPFSWVSASFRSDSQPQLSVLFDEYIRQLPDSAWSNHGSMPLPA
jgi:hypothetical protein